MSEWIEAFIIPALFFIIPLLILVFIKFGYRLSKRKISFTIPKNSSKYGYILLLIALVLCILSIAPIAGQGYDVPYFVFTADYIHNNGIQEIFRTDRPLTYFLTDMIVQIADVPGRVAVPISAVAFTTFYVLSIFILSLTLTKNTLISGMAVLLAAGSNIIRLTALCFVGNILGFAFLYLFFAAIIKFYESGKKLYFGISIVLFICLFFSHFISALIAVIILIIFFFYLLITKERKRLARLGSCVLLYFTSFIFFLIGYGENLFVLNNLTGNEITTIGTFLQYLAFDWSSNYIWIFVFALIGIFVILFEHSTSKKFLMAWVLGLTIVIVCASTETSRIFIYLPFSILSSIGIYFIIDRYLRRYKKQIIILTLLFLILIPSVYAFRMRHMNIKYVEEGPFAWDTKFLETEQLKWIKHNYDINSIVVVTNLLWDAHPAILSERGLIAGIHYRLLAEVGNNVYFGNLNDLFTEKPDTRGNIRVPFGLYSSLNIDWTLKNKTILIPSTIYEISEEEKEICYEVTEGIYAVKPLTKEEKANWLIKIG